MYAPPHTQHAANTQNKENMQGEYKIEFSNNPPYSLVAGNDEKIIFNFLNLSLQQQCKRHNCVVIVCTILIINIS